MLTFICILLTLIAGVVVTLVFAMRIGAQKGLSRAIMRRAGLWGLLGALWGGHLFETMHDPVSALADPIVLLDIWGGSKSVFGAFAGAAFFGLIYLRAKRASILAYADAASPAIALGYFMARLGCFLNGDDFGTLTNVPWAVTFGPGTEAFADHVARGWITRTAASTLPVHPAQLYHAAAGITLFMVLARWRGAWQGSRFALALAAYGAVRFFLQFFRGDSSPVVAGLDDAQLFSLLFIVAAAMLWLKQGRKQRASEPAGTASVPPGISVADVQ